MISIILAGVGGQGIILASDILGEAARLDGYKVSITETKGLAQRGGSVLSFIRIYKNGFVSPIIPLNSADILIGFELLESLRRINYLRKDGVAILNTRRIDPINVKMRMHNYPSFDAIRREFNKLTDKIYIINAYEIAAKVGSTRSENIVLLGFATGLSALPLSQESIIEAMKSRIPGRYLEVNIKAFQLGMNFAKKVK